MKWWSTKEKEEEEKSGKERDVFHSRLVSDRSHCTNQISRIEENEEKEKGME